MNDFDRKTARRLRQGLTLPEAVACSRPDLAERLARGDSVAEVLGLDHESDDLVTTLEARARGAEMARGRGRRLGVELAYPLLVLALWSLLALGLGQGTMVVGMTLALVPLALWYRPMPPWREQADFLIWLEVLTAQGYPLPTAAKLARERAGLKRWRTEAGMVCQQLERGATLEQAFGRDPLAPLLRLPGAAGRVAALLERRADWGWGWLLGWLEPVLLVGLGLLVALLWWQAYPGIHP
ncbi:MAG: hypothetical protein AB7S38_19350 [Vulcanimicrobiota bacterium]